MKIVMISGKQGAGKTTISNALREKLSNKNEPCVQLKFADVLYEMHDEVLKVLYRYWDQRAIKKDGDLLQLLGTEWGRKTIDENIWVKILQRRVHVHQSQPPWPNIIIDDCRFPNEFDAFPDALRIRLRAEEGARKKRCEMWRENTNHPSEIALDQYAVSGRFDLYLNTDDYSVTHCITMICAQMDKNIWKEKRL